MLYSSFLLPVLLALSTSVAAAPSTPTSTEFTFAQWIEDIIADPTGDHLSPEEAVAAKNAAVASNTLGKRINCDQNWGRANANDAASCLSDLARKGAAGTRCVVGNDQFGVQMCRIGNAQVAASKSERSAQGANCNDVARTGGLVFDSCWRSDGTVKGSEICVGNRLMQVNILAP
ncbi:hypothetical protein N0V87_001026 [Didymella glomerata]|uniref:Uncharacterized protein n=1 Tax=Didymella glomerata TaxID=749621 RepID=A0A9W9C404_9PLEO|nr:hypothetical protein N0V87_001026 [Didymella glomerata]